MKTLVFAVALSLLMLPVPGSAEEAVGAEEDHQALRQLLWAVKEAINTRDAELLKSHLHESYALTVLNQQVVSGETGVDDLFRDWFRGPNAPLKRLKVDPVATVPTQVFDGRFGTVYGTSTDAFQLATGDTYVFKTHWTASVIKEEGDWLLLNVHIGTNPLDNAFLDEYRKGMGFGGVIIEIARFFEDD